MTNPRADMCVPCRFGNHSLPWQYCGECNCGCHGIFWPSKQVPCADGKKHFLDRNHPYLFLLSVVALTIFFVWIEWPG